MRARSSAFALTGVLCLVVAGCPGGHVAHDEPHGPSSAPSRWVRVRAPEDLSLLEAPARVVSTTAAQGEVTPTMTMRVVALHVAPGAHVTAGQPILDAVVPEVLTAAAHWIAASRQAGVHRERRTTLEGLRGEGMVEEGRVFEQTARLAELSTDQASALAVLQSLDVRPSEVAATLRRGTVSLRAPLAGVVRELDVRIGEVRQAGDRPFARIVGEATPRIEVQSGQPFPAIGTATFHGTDGSDVVLGPAVSTVTDPVDGTHVAWLDPLDPLAAPRGTLVDGLRGTVRWSIASGSAFEVPAQALRMEPGRTLVLRRRGDAAEPVVVTVIVASGTTAIVSGPLAAIDEVAADAATVLRAPETTEEQ